MKKHTLKYKLLIISSLFPVISFAALDGVKGLLQAFVKLLNLVIPAIFGLSLIYFLWGGSQFILKAGEQKARDEGKKKMLWGIVALFVMISIYGIVRAIGLAFNIAPGGDMSDIFNLPR